MNLLGIRARLIMLKRMNRFPKGMKCGDRLRAIGCFEYSFQFDQRVVASFTGDEPLESVNRRGVLREESLARVGICAAAQVPHKRLVVRGKVEPGISPWTIGAERRRTENREE
jgi:hypothetical protein